MDIKTNNFLSIEQIRDQYLTEQGTQQKQYTSNISFKDIFEVKSKETAGQEVRFSKHAMNRLKDRNISLSDNQLERLNDAALKAERKGIKETLVLVDSLAFIVNVPNNTVVTAMDSTEAAENVFTNIDGAVIN
ncbi:MAG: flagellar protein [Lachnospiraceae bacterium]|nr:flagellar protein [Lachnospiraceae bacterium]